jgi:hypothetical protein
MVLTLAPVPRDPDRHSCVTLLKLSMNDRIPNLHRKSTVTIADEFCPRIIVIEALILRVSTLIPLTSLYDWRKKAKRMPPGVQAHSNR